MALAQCRASQRRIRNFILLSRAKPDLRRRCDRGDLMLDPGAHFLVELARVATGCFDRRPDHDANDARLLHPAAARPVVTRVVRDRARSCSPRARRAARRSLRTCASRRRRRECLPGRSGSTCPSRSRCVPCSITCVHRRGAGLAIDRDRLQAAHGPADQRDPHQLALQHPRLRRKDRGLRDRFPRGRMLPHRDVRAGRDVLAALDTCAADRRAFSAATDACAPSSARRRTTCDAAASPRRRPRRRRAACRGTGTS